jgi:hypothetical protein
MHMNDPSSLPSHYYDFGRYVDRQRWLTYLEQLRLIQQSPPGALLEIGVGPGIVRTILESRGWSVTTVDVNASLQPDHVADMRSLPPEVAGQRWDWVLCSRVLHHVPAGELPGVLDALSALHAERFLVTVPREDLSIQVGVRRTAGRVHTLRVSGGATLKRKLRRFIPSAPSGLWMLDGNGGPSRRAFRETLEQAFLIDDEYVFRDDPSHIFYLLRSRTR